MKAKAMLAMLLACWAVDLILVSAAAASSPEPRIYYVGQPANSEVGLIYELKPDGLTVTRTFPTPAGLHFTDALAFDGTFLWISDQDTDDVFKFNVLTGQRVVTMQYPGPWRDMGATYKNGHLFFSDGITHNKIVEVDPTTFSVIKTANLPNDWSTGLAAWGNDLVLAYSNSISIIDGNTFGWKTHIGSVSSGSVAGVAAVDGRIFAAVNYAPYKMAIQEFSLSGQVLQSVDVTSWGLGTGLDAGYLVPEPATLSLLALGGLAVIRRRRK